MPKFVLSCCSTADMPAEFFEKNKIPYVCFHYQIDGREYEDDLGRSIPFAEFYQKIEKGAQPTTSQVNVEQYLSHFEPFLKEGKDVLHLTLSSGISGTYNSARVAQEMLQEKYPDRKILVSDSLSASSGYGLLVTAACEKRDQEMEIEEVFQWVEENKNHVHHWFFSSDLTSYFRGGRISAASAFFGTVLKICPVLHVNQEGKLIPRTKCRGKKRAMEEMLRQMELHAEGGLDYAGKCYLSQSACLEDAKTLAEMIEKKFPKLDGKVQIQNIGAVIGSHTGPGTVALFFFGDER
ncbi:MAG: DegV family protein [bacterium]|nr:DegV family protein [bacterium]